jgi:hypothetical protein
MDSEPTIASHVAAKTAAAGATLKTADVSQVAPPSRQVVRGNEHCQAHGRAVDRGGDRQHAGDARAIQVPGLTQDASERIGQGASIGITGQRGPGPRRRDGALLMAGQGGQRRQPGGGRASPVLLARSRAGPRGWLNPRGQRPLSTVRGRT